MTDLRKDRTASRGDIATLSTLLDCRAREQPKQQALIFPNESVTYAQLAHRVELVARGLIGMGLLPGDAVGVLMPNCVDSIAALLAAMNIGALPVPINPRFKSYELRSVIVHSRVRALLTCAPESPEAPDFPALLTETFPHLAVETGVNAVADAEAPDLRTIVVCDQNPGRGCSEALREPAERVGASQVHREKGLVAPSDTAIVMYTSGTTAAPKGAMISHAAVLGFAAGTANDRFEITPRDRVWSPLPLFHIGGLAFAFASLYAGVPYCHVGFFHPDAALDQLEQEKPTIVLAGFETIWLPVVNHPDFANRDLSRVRIVMAVGVPERLRDMASRLPRATQVSCFGMTEASAFLSLNHQSDTLEQRVTTGGHPLPGMECRVVDPDTGAEAGPDSEGELVFRGANCFDGYFRDPELTNQVFDEDGWFHTGDIATVDRSGRVTFVSRIKDMLKVGGENVSAVEVEGFLLQHPAVRIAQVVGAPDSYYVEVPVAYIELNPGMSATEHELIEFCRGRIASYRVPRYVRFIDEWPMSGTKIKKYVLRDSIANELHAHGITQAPRLGSSTS